MWIAYLVCAVLEVLSIILWCVIRVKEKDEDVFECTRMSEYERGKKVMEENGWTAEEYIDECVYSKQFFAVAFTLGSLAIIIPLRIWFTKTLIEWHKMAIEEEADIDRVVE